MLTQDIAIKLERVFTPEQASVLRGVIVDTYSELVKGGDFNELKGIVRNLGIKMGELAQAQKETEIKVSELAEAQKETEIRVSELAIAQKETQKEVTRLDKTMRELAIAQKETKEELRTLVISHKDLQKQVGGLSHTVGFRLEDESYKALPELLEKDFGIITKESLKRRYIKDREDKHIEINIVGEATRNGKKLTIVGEGKSQLSKNDIDDFIRKKIKRLNGVFDEIFPVLITYMTQEYDVEEYAKKKGIALYYSYDF